MPKKLFAMLSVLVAASLLLAACASSSTSASSNQGTTVSGQPVQVNGAGATFPLPVYTEWIFAYQSVDPSVTINYQGIGSGGGKKGIVDGTIDFAGSDSVLTDAEYAAGKDLQMYPVLAGAVVPIYNLQGVDTALVLDRTTLADIYLGRVTKWNDPAILATNAALQDKLPDQPITVVHRSDGSGTTEMFTNALASFSETWKSDVGAGTAVEWPVDKQGNGVGGKGNQGVAAAVQNTPNAIGYVELSYAVSNQLPFASLVNKAGNVVAANASSLASAMSDFSSSFTDKLTNIIVDGPGANSWPISGYTYLVLHTTSMKDCAKAAKIVQFWTWALTDPAPAKKAADLGYSVLPPDVQTRVLAQLDKVTCNGNPVVSSK